MTYFADADGTWCQKKIILKVIWRVALRNLASRTLRQLFQHVVVFIGNFIRETLIESPKCFQNLPN